MTATQLNERFPNLQVTFRDAPGDFCFIDVENQWGRAEISLYGGHVLTFQSVGGLPVLWMSDDAVLDRGTAIRGGIPVCWPWFGGREGLPSHGFARTSEWSVESVSSLEGETHVVLSLSQTDATLAMWPHPFTLTLDIGVGEALTLALTTHNTGATPISLTQALHSYFTVGCIHDTVVTGLEGARYLDTVGEVVENVQEGAITFTGETDRDYVETTATCVIEDPVLGRSIQIEKSGSNSTIVWNPWVEKSKRMTDFPDDAFPGMLCVETANATSFDTIAVEPGASHTLSARITVS